MQEDDSLGAPLTSTSLQRAAEYVRMSTEHQQYSTENQAAKIREYADCRGISIVRTYADEGKSGLRIDGRRVMREENGNIRRYEHIQLLLFPPYFDDGRRNGVDQ